MFAIDKKRFERQIPSMKNAYERYGYYLKYIRLIGNLPLTQTPTIKSIGLDRGAIQMGYREMREIEFQGSITEYISYVSSLALLDNWADQVLRSQEGEVDPIGLLDQILTSRPEDTMNVVRVIGVHRNPVNKFTPVLAERLHALFSQPDRMDLLLNAILRIGTFRRLLHAYDEGGEARAWATRELDRPAYANIIRHYIAIQEVARDSRASFPARTTSQSRTPEPPGEITYSGNSPSSEKAPSGAAREANRNDTSPRRSIAEKTPRKGRRSTSS